MTISANWADYHPGFCPGCVDFLATAYEGSFAAAGCIENSGFTGQNGSGAVELGPAPSKPGIYNIIGSYEEVYSCGEFWPSGSTAVIGEVVVAVPPVVTTGSATEVTRTSVTLNGTVNPSGAELSACVLEYGTTTAYGSSVPCSATPTGEAPSAGVGRGHGAR